MSRSALNPKPKITKATAGQVASDAALPNDYFRIRDFEYVQPLYDLAFLLEVSALSKGGEVPKYRTFSLWRAGYSLDGYGTTIDRWLDGTATDSDLDYVPSSRIREYLNHIRRTGTIPELREYRTERYLRCLRLRSVRGLGPSQIALTISSNSLPEDWFSQAAIKLNLEHDRITELYNGTHFGPWQSAHVVPPLLRLLRTTETFIGRTGRWAISGITDPFQEIKSQIVVQAAAIPHGVLQTALRKAVRKEKQFRLKGSDRSERFEVRHQMGWRFEVSVSPALDDGKSLFEWVQSLDPIGCAEPQDLRADLHLHTAWSDGSASVSTMAEAIAAQGLSYFAVTDHSRSSKLQGGLTPILWLRQANALKLASPICPVLHGIEVDILRDGELDLPHSLLAAADIVIGSVHTNWSDDANENTQRLIRAVESGCIDILAHPTSAVVGKPGVPDYFRAPAEVDWDVVFRKCAEWRVALEFNCFPSRLDLPIPLLQRAISAGCAISLGSDAHARSHLLNLRFGQVVLRRLSPNVVLNRLTMKELLRWVRESRARRANLSKSGTRFVQEELFHDAQPKQSPALVARIRPPQNVPMGSKIVGIDLTAGNKDTGVAVLNGFSVETCSLNTDAEILSFIEAHEPKIVSIDSPLGLPGGGTTVDRKAGIVRVAEYDLASIGIPAYPALIDSMEKLTLRGIQLRRAIEQLPGAPRVIESYPGAAQDILCIPRKQKSLELLREGLRRLGLSGPGLETRSDDEMDAITSAIVGRYFEAGVFEPMGIPSEAQLIVPKVAPLMFEQNPVICLAGKTGAGKSVVARYLSVFYGFEWVRTRNVIRELLLNDQKLPMSRRMFRQVIDPSLITEKTLREFGALILDTYKQIPLRKALTKAIQNRNLPVVVDSIRDIVDVDRAMLRGRQILTWFIDCPENIIKQRLAERSKDGEKRLKVGSPVDRTAEQIRLNADDSIKNGGTLEDLRWEVDDTLFSRLRLEIAPVNTDF